LEKQHQHTFKKLNAYSNVVISSFLLTLLLNNCDGNDKKQCIFLGGLSVALTRDDASEKKLVLF